MTGDSMTFDQCVEHLRRQLAEPLPGSEAQLQMAPAFRADPKEVQIAGKTCREAAVMALIYPVDGSPTLLFTRRHDDLTDHAGQISFPGGRQEADETHLAGALREMHEEVGLAPHDIDVLGALTPLYIPPTGFCVYPFVGSFDRRPSLTPHDAEVAAILEVPLAHLLAPHTRQAKLWDVRGERVEVPFFDIDGHPPLWGATAMILAELLALIKWNGSS